MKRPFPDAPFQKVLVANRGEIAVRVIAAIHELGGLAVAVYSDPDESALHVDLADEAYRIGPGPAVDSYLNIDAILKAALDSRSQAIHPGYGFLSENADFAAAVVAAGLTFIGPPPEVIRLMGDKVAAKRLMASHGVPLVPGYDGEHQDVDTLVAEASRIGFPVMVKAAAGGGGRGMRVVESAAELPGALETAGREARTAFGDGRVFLEKFLVAPRHVEVQVLGDQQGRIIHLFERDCSVQRRHQKVIEEAPSPALSEEERLTICAMGVQAARAAGYVNAGTVEFLWDKGNFYFLEMNTRIQVEHGVTELATGRDLVRAQIEIAAGRPLSWAQDDIRLHGHAVEARLYAEDPDLSFLPQFGQLTDLSWRKSPRPESTGSRLVERLDVGYRARAAVPRYYDSLLAKLMVLAPTRTDAIQGLASLLDGSRVTGVKTNLSFLLWVLSTPTFRSGEATIAFLDTEWRSGLTALADPEMLPLIAAASLYSVGAHSSLGNGASPFREQAGWRTGGVGIPLAFRTRGHGYHADLRRRGDFWQIEIDGTAVFERARIEPGGEDRFVVHFEGGSFAVGIQPGSGDDLLVAPEGSPSQHLTRVSLIDWQASRTPAREPHGGASGVITAPMPGTVVTVAVGEGDEVQAHQPLVVMEAMKMEHVLEAPHTGVVRAIHFKVGDLVAGGDVILDLVDS